jgi:hypothetical protein
MHIPPEESIDAEISPLSFYHGGYGLEPYSDRSVLIPATVPEHNSATLISGGTSNQ